MNLEWSYVQMVMYALLRYMPKILQKGSTQEQEDVKVTRRPPKALSWVSSVSCTEAHYRSVPAWQAELGYSTAELMKSTGFSMFEHAMAEQVHALGVRPVTTLQTHANRSYRRSGI